MFFDTFHVVMVKELDVAIGMGSLHILIHIFSRQPIELGHLHDARGKRCAEVHNEISEGIAHFIDLSNHLNWTAHELHDHQSCHCDRGKIGKARKAAANEKRREY